MIQRPTVIALFLLTPLLLAGLVILWLCYTASGLQFALQQLNRVPNLAVQVSGVSGRLAGPLHVAHLVLDHERVHIEIEQADVDLTPAYLLSGLIEINRLQVERVKVTLKPKLHDSPDQPLHFLPTFLRISVDALELRQAEYLHTSGYQLIAAPLRGSAALSRTRLRVRDLEAVTREFVARGALTLDAARQLSLDAVLDADYQLVNGPLLRGHLRAQGPVTGAARALSFTAQLHQPHEAVLDGQLAFPDEGWSVQGRARAEQVLLDAWWRQPAFSLRKLTMQFRLSNAGMHYLGEVIVPEWSPVPLHIDADTRYAQRVFTLQRVDVSMPQSGVQARATGSITLQQDARPLLDLRGKWSYLQWPLQVAAANAWFTSTQGAVTLKGVQPYQFELDGRIALPQWPDSALQASGDLRPGEVRVARYALGTLQGTATGMARVELAMPRNWQLEVHAQNLNPGEWRAAWPGRVNMNASANGRGFNAHAAFDVNVHSLQGSLRGQTLNGRGRVQHQEKRWAAEAVELQWGRTHLAAQGEIGAQNNLRWNLTAPVLQQLHPDLSGELTMSGAFSGTADTAQLSLLAQAARIGYGDWLAEHLKLDTHVDLTDRSHSRLELSAARLAQGNTALENVQLSGDGQASEHQLTLQAVPVHALLPAGLQLQLQVAGGYATQQWQGRLNTLQVVDADRATRMMLVEPVPLLLAKNHVRMQSLCLVVDRGRACADADWMHAERQGAQWNTHATLQDLPIVVGNTALTASTRLQARVNGQLELAASANSPWQGSGWLKLEEASLRYRPAGGREQSIPINVGELHMAADAQVMQTSGELRIGEQTVASLNSTLERHADMALPNWPLRGVLALSSSDAKLIPVFVNEVDKAEGTLAAALQLSGTVATPHFAGTVRLLQGALDFYQLNLALRGLEVDAQVDTDRLGFTAQGNAGEGLLQASGELGWREARLLGTLQLKGENLLVADLPEYRVLASPDLHFDINDRNINVKGTVLIPEARLQPKEVAGAVQTSADARFRTDQVLERKSHWLINSDVDIRLGENVNFDGLGLQGRLNGAVNTRLRTGNVAEGNGELSISNGRYEAYAQKLDIKRGRLIFDSTPLSDPGLDIQAERKINDIIVGVNVRGVLRSPRLQFYSEPSMSQTQIVSYLLVGKPLDELQGQEATTVRSASNTLAIKGGGYLAAQLGRRIGLEEVDVETDAKNQSSLVLGKFLSPRLFISYGISLTEAINTVKLRYTLSDHWTLKTEAGAAKSADIEFKIER